MGSGVVGAVLPVRPHVDRVVGLEWRRRERWEYLGTWGNHQYVATFNQRGRDQWAVQFTDGQAPFRYLDAEASAVVVAGLKAWLVASGLEVPR